MDAEHIKLYQKCIELWGSESQLIMLMEECAELIQASSKYYRTGETDELLNEMADVLIMIEQVLTVFSLDMDVLDTIKQEKLNLLQERLVKYNRDNLTLIPQEAHENHNETTQSSLE